MDIVLDFDGTCVTHDFPNVGKDIGAVPAKAYGQIIIDDAALGCPLIYNKHERPYVDWCAVEFYFEKNGLLTKT